MKYVQQFNDTHCHPLPQHTLLLRQCNKMNNLYDTIRHAKFYGLQLILDSWNEMFKEVVRKVCGLPLAPLIERNMPD